jgi:hypothetical protein
MAPCSPRSRSCEAASRTAYARRLCHPRHLNARSETTTVGESPPLKDSTPVPQDDAGAEARMRSPAGAQSFRSPVLHQIDSRRQTKRNFARCTCGRSCAVAVCLKRREEGWGNSGISTPDKSAARKMALRIAARSVSALAPHQPPVFRSTYWARLETEISQSHSRAAIIALRMVQWEALFE